MELETLVTKNAKDYCDKIFGDKDPELKSIVRMNLELDPDDTEDEEKKEKFLQKMRREHIKDSELLKETSFLIHDSSGNLVPYIYK